jgi:hypothetical protein
MFEAEVARGAAWLDEHKPGWERTIDLSGLRMAECRSCVLGQAFAEQALAEEQMSGFDVALEQMPEEYAAKLGFDIDGEVITTPSMWSELGDAWGALIKDRFDKGELSG